MTLLQESKGLAKKLNLHICRYAGKIRINKSGDFHDSYLVQVRNTREAYFWLSGVYACLDRVSNYLGKQTEWNADTCQELGEMLDHHGFNPWGGR